jgi:hypothetical protein
MKKGKKVKIAKIVKAKTAKDVTIIKISEEVWDIFQQAMALNGVFRLGYIPAREEFYELTPEQYKRYYETEGKGMGDEDKKIFMLLPSDIKKYNELAAGDVFVCTEEEISKFASVEKLIDKYCENSEETFETFEEKLSYVAKIVPDYCTKGTRFEQKRVIYFDNKKS